MSWRYTSLLHALKLNNNPFNALISYCFSFKTSLHFYLGPISHPVVKRWLLKPAFKHSLTSVYLSFSISHPVVKH